MNKGKNMLKDFLKELAGAIIFGIILVGIVYIGLTTSPLYG